MDYANFKVDGFVLNHNMIVKVEGKSSKGKNRIIEHGLLWRVAVFNGSMNRVGLESLNTQYVRWVDSQNDKDFKIVFIEGIRE